MKTEVEKVTKWLNDVAKNTKKAHELSKKKLAGHYYQTTSRTYGCTNDPYVQLYKTTRMIEKVLGITVEVNDDYDEDARELRFIWDGVMFIELEDKE